MDWYINNSVIGADDDVIVDYDDVVNFDSDTATHLRGLQQLYDGYRTVAVFDDYSTFNIYGRPSDIIVNGQTVVHNDPIAEPTYVETGLPYTLNGETKYYYSNSSIAADEDDTIELSSEMAGHLRGVQSYYDGYRTLMSFDDFSALNIYGRPGNVIVNGQTIVHNDAPADSEDWGDSDSVDTYDGIILADEDDVINLSNVTFNDIRGIKIEDQSAIFVFNDYTALNVFGRADAVVIGNDTYDINYDNHSLNKIESES